MDDFAGRTAVVTGAGTGIGLALAQALAALEMNVVLADVDVAKAELAAANLASTGASVLAVGTDVSRPDSVDDLASATAATFGPVHLLANNAGILRPGSTYEQDLADWQAVFGVNVFGVVHGLRSFVPGMLAHGEPCHVLNTASFGGLAVAPYMAAYIASKFAVVAISETLAAEVEGTAMGVTVLCPGGVATDIYRSELARRATEGVRAGEVTESVFAGFAAPDRDDQASPDEIAAAALEAIRSRALHSLAFGGPQRAMIEARWARIDAVLRTIPLS